MGTKYIKKKFDKQFQEAVIKDYQTIKSIRKVSFKNKITTRQVVNILNDNKINHSKVRKTTLDEDYFNKYNINSDVMYWAGFLAADGNVINNPFSRTYFATVHLSEKDINHILKLKNCLKATSKITHCFSNGGIINQKQIKPTKTCKISFFSKKLVESLIFFNIAPAKSKIYNIPKNLYNHKFINHFIRGYLDGDGSISFKNKYLRLTFYGTKNCLNSISYIIQQNCNINPKAISKNRTIFATEYSGKQAELVIKYLYKDCNIYLDRKYLKIKHLL